MDAMVLKVQEWLNENYQLGITEDGVTGQGTFKGLIKALQTELGIAADGSFGNGTLNACPSSIQSGETNEKLVYVLQGSFLCKGYNPGGFDGKFGAGTTRAVKQFQSDAGITENGIVTPYILQGIMNTDGYVYTGTEGTNEYYKHLVQKGMNEKYGDKIGLTAPNGLWERKSHKNYIKCCQIEWGLASVDGVWGNGTMSKAPTLSRNTVGYTNSKRLLQWGLAINGFYPGGFTGTFGDGTYNAVYNFQDFMCLGADGIAGKNTWAALLSTKGNTARKATAFDTSTKLTADTATKLKAAGYNDVGRYLTNTKSGTLDKKMTKEELKIIEEAGLNVFPIYQTYGGEASYFTWKQGRNDGGEAKKAAQSFGFPSTVTIYFAIDYDALMEDIKTNIIPYFKGIREVVGRSFKIGVYGPRAVCNKLLANGLAKYSFVSDMSSGFTGNIGQIMPSNWAYEQFSEITECGIGIDKCMASPRKTAISPKLFVSYEVSEKPEVPQDFKVFENVYELAMEYLESLSGPFTGVYATEFEANQLALAYFRSETYDAAGFEIGEEFMESVKGLAWRTMAGVREERLIANIEEKYPDLKLEEVSILDPENNIQLEITHYAATMGACLSGTAGIFIDFLERDIDAYAGWVGDLLQMGAILENTLNLTGNNYFNKSDLKNMIGSPDSSLDKYNIVNANGDKLNHAGFSQVDLLQDIDAYNIARTCDLASKPLHEVLNDYYNVSKKYKNRYSIFKKELLEEFDANSIKEVVLPFSNQDKFLFASIFGRAFGKFSKNYSEVVAEAFEEKIEELIATEQ